MLSTTRTGNNHDEGTNKRHCEKSGGSPARKSKKDDGVRRYMNKVKSTHSRSHISKPKRFVSSSSDQAKTTRHQKVVNNIHKRKETFSANESIDKLRNVLANDIRNVDSSGSNMLLEKQSTSSWNSQSTSNTDDNSLSQPLNETQSNVFNSKELSPSKRGNANAGSFNRKNADNRPEIISDVRGDMLDYMQTSRRQEFHKLDSSLVASARKSLFNSPLRNDNQINKDNLNLKSSLSSEDRRIDLNKGQDFDASTQQLFNDLLVSPNKQIEAILQSNNNINKSLATSFSDASFNTILAEIRELKSEIQKKSSGYSEDLRKIIRALSNIDDILKQLIARVKNLEEQDDDSYPEPPDCLRKAIDSLQEMDAFEKADKKQYKQLVKFFKFLGGRNMEDCIKNCLLYSITSKFACNYTPYGKEDKLPFGKTKLFKAIFESIRKKYNPTQAEYMSAISKRFKSHVQCYKNLITKAKDQQKRKTIRSETEAVINDMFAERTSVERQSRQSPASKSPTPDSVPRQSNSRSYSKSPSQSPSRDRYSSGSCSDSSEAAAGRSETSSNNDSDTEYLQLDNESNDLPPM